MCCKICRDYNSSVALLPREGQSMLGTALELNECTVEPQRTWFVSPSVTTAWRRWVRIISEATRRLRCTTESPSRGHYTGPRRHIRDLRFTTPVQQIKQL